MVPTSKASVAIRALREGYIASHAEGVYQFKNPNGYRVKHPRRIDRDTNGRAIAYFATPLSWGVKPRILCIEVEALHELEGHMHKSNIPIPGRIHSVKGRATPAEVEAHEVLVQEPAPEPKDQATATEEPVPALGDDYSAEAVTLRAIAEGYITVDPLKAEVFRHRSWTSGKRENAPVKIGGANKISITGPLIGTGKQVLSVPLPKVVWLAAFTEIPEGVQVVMKDLSQPPHIDNLDLIPQGQSSSQYYKAMRAKGQEDMSVRYEGPTPAEKAVGNDLSLPTIEALLNGYGEPHSECLSIETKCDQCKTDLILAVTDWEIQHQSANLRIQTLDSKRLRWYEHALRGIANATSSPGLKALIERIIEAHGKLNG